MKTYFLSATLCFVLLGCATSRRSGFEETQALGTMSEKEVMRLKQEARTAWSRRHEKDQIKAAIDKWETVSRTSAVDYEVLLMLTHGYYLLADAHEDDIEVKKALWEKGAAFGERAMATNPAVRAAVAQKKTIDEFLPLVTKAEVGAVYWTASNLGKWAKHSGIATQLKYKTRIKELINTVDALESTFFYGAVNRYWGGFYALAPGFAGGDVDKAEKSFKKSLEIAPYYLGTKVLMAEAYYTKKQDRKGFEKILAEVLGTPDAIHPALVPENILEKRKAEKLLKRVDELF